MPYYLGERIESTASYRSRHKNEEPMHIEGRIKFSCNFRDLKGPADESARRPIYGIGWEETPLERITVTSSLNEIFTFHRTDKKEKKIFLIYKEIGGIGCKVIYD
jgi:hypothetical protein